VWYRARGLKREAVQEFSALRQFLKEMSLSTNLIKFTMWAELDHPYYAGNMLQVNEATETLSQEPNLRKE
jgi:hypothetical protein